MNEHDLAIVAGCVGGPHTRGKHPETCEECVALSARADLYNRNAYRAMLHRALAADHKAARLHKALADLAGIAEEALGELE